MDKKKILLVEDDDALSGVYKSRLEMEGFEVMEVNNGEKALSVVNDFNPDLIVLDAMMPKMSGFDVLDTIRKNNSAVSDVKVIMLTALSQEKDKELAKSLGASEYLVKSQVVIGEVVEHIKRLLGLK